MLLKQLYKYLNKKNISNFLKLMRRTKIIWNLIHFFKKNNDFIVDFILNCLVLNWFVCIPLY